MQFWKYLLPLLASSLCFAAQSDRILVPIDSSQMVALKGNVHGLAQSRFDLGRADGGMLLHGVSIVFHPSAAQQKDLDNLLAQQQDRSSPNYHKWLTPVQFGKRFGMTQNDIQRVSGWLESQGLTVTAVANSRNQISFDGTVAQVESAFGTEMHNYLVDGEIHFANAVNPAVPAALAGSVLAVVHLNNFQPKPRARVQSHFTSALSGNHYLSPGDFATIYDVDGLYNGGIDGTGQKIAIIGQSAVNPTDLSHFRSAAGLAAKAPTYVLVPSSSTSAHCSGDEGESDLDLEWSGGVAKNADIVFVYAGLVGTDTCASRFNDVWNALHYAVDTSPIVAPVISTSYGYCESGLGQSFTDTVRGYAQEANTQGQTIMAASGDSGAADCDPNSTDPNNTSATGGLAVDVPASIPEVTGMGGNVFTGDPAGTVSGGNAGATTYWSGTTGGNDAISSALSYIPEQAWNDTVADGTLSASGGGASIYFTKQAGEANWQTGTGVPNDGKRDVPDISFSASPNHDGYLFCSPMDGAGNPSCTSGFRDSQTFLDVVGGTSTDAPTFAAVVALLNQYLGASGLGNVNPNLYELAAGDPTAFHDVTAGDNIVPCTSGTPDCPSGTVQFGFTTGIGYDQVTGLGSVDAHELAKAWGASRPATTTSIAASSGNAYQGVSVTFTATLAPSTASGPVTFYNNGSTTALGTAALVGGTAAFSTTTLPTGSNSVTATYYGDKNDNTSVSATPAVVTVTAPFTISASPSTFSVPAGQPASLTITVTPVSGFSGAVNFNPSISPPGGCTAGLPQGATCSFGNGGSVQLDGNPSHPKTLSMTITTTANMALASGAQVTVTGTSGATSNFTTVTLTVTATNQSFTITPQTSTYSVAAGVAASVSITVTGTSGFIVGTAPNTTTALPLNYSCTGLPSESVCNFSPTQGAAVTATAVALNIKTSPPVTELRSPFGRGRQIFYAMLLPGLFGIVLAAGSRTRGARLLGLVVVLGFSTLGLGSCGGSNSSQKDPGTPAGTYTVTVSATTTGANPLTSSFQVSLTVTQ